MSNETVLDLLLHQHNQVKQLLAELRDGHGDKQAKFNELVRALAVHESAEEQIVHPAARRAHAGAQVVDQRLHEESEAKHVLSELYDLGVDHPEFDKKFAEFADSVLEHATHEEDEEFPALDRATSEQDLRRLAGAVRAAEAIAPTRPHPGAGESAIANMIAGPPMAIFDRARDAVRDWASSHKS